MKETLSGQSWSDVAPVSSAYIPTDSWGKHLCCGLFPAFCGLFLCSFLLSRSSNLGKNVASGWHFNFIESTNIPNNLSLKFSTQC